MFNHYMHSITLENIKLFKLYRNNYINHQTTGWCQLIPVRVYEVKSGFFLHSM